MPRIIQSLAGKTVWCASSAARELHAAVDASRFILAVENGYDAVPGQWPRGERRDQTPFLPGLEPERRRRSDRCAAGGQHDAVLQRLPLHASDVYLRGAVRAPGRLDPHLG